MERIVGNARTGMGRVDLNPLYANIVHLAFSLEE